MTVLVLNGSPLRRESHTYQVTKSFLQGFPEDTQIIEEEISTLNIKPCSGCFACWYITPGKCVQNDDMKRIYEGIKKADIIVLSFPLYFFGLPSEMKAVVDRCLPYELPYRGTVNTCEHGLLDSRYPDELAKKKFVLISSCEYVYAEVVYEALLAQFDLILGKGNYDKIFVSEGMLLVDKTLQRQVGNYLSIVTKAGSQFALDGKIEEKTAKKLERPIFSQKVFEFLTDTHWTKLINEHSKE